MRYVLVDIKKGDMFDEEFLTADEAVNQGEYEWNHLTDREKEQREAFYIVASEDEEGIEGNLLKVWK